MAMSKSTLHLFVALTCLSLVSSTFFSPFFHRRMMMRMRMKMKRIAMMKLKRSMMGMSVPMMGMGVPMMGMGAPTMGMGGPMMGMGTHMVGMGSPMMQPGLVGMIGSGALMDGQEFIGVNDNVDNVIIAGGQFPGQRVISTDNIDVGTLDAPESSVVVG